jgi:type IV pilus assembly protein PilM
VVGLDIGTDSIKVAEAKFAKDGITITGLGIARTPQGAIENEVIVDSKALGDAIKALLNESGIKTRKCVSCVSGASQVVVRVISVPKMKREELAETMKWEVERHVPFSPSEVVMDFQPLDLPGADPAAAEMEVLLAVAQQQLIDSHVEALLAAGLKPIAIDIEPLAVSRSLVELSKNGAMSETVAVVNIGSARTDLGIFENGILTFPSPPVGVAGINFTREIAEALGQTLEQAEVTKREFAAVNLDGFQTVPDDDPAPQPPPAAEPTVFDTAFSPAAGISSPFDLDETTPDESGLAAEPASPSDFVDTIDGPVFDVSDGIGPSFDLGAVDQPAAAPAGPSFDLGGDVEEPAAPAAPAFDLADDEPEPEPEPVAEPSFDLSDAGKEADHGQQAEPQVATPVTASAPVAFEDGSTEAQVFQAISGVLVDLANELRMSFDYYSNRYSKMPERVYLCGGTAKMPKLDEFLSRELGLPVVVADPIKNLPVQMPGASPQYLNEISPLLSVCIGLAIRDMIG